MIVEERMRTYINSLDMGNTPFLEELEKELTLQSEIVTPDNAEELLAKYSGSDDGAAEETEETDEAEEKTEE